MCASRSGSICRPPLILIVILPFLCQWCFGAPVFRVIKSFGDPDRSGTSPSGKLTEGPDGRLFGVTARGGLHDGGTLYTIDRDGGGYRALHHFDTPGGVSRPTGTLVLGNDGHLYGTTQTSGGPGRLSLGGAIFRFSVADRSFTVIKGIDDEPHSSHNRTCDAGVIEGSDGALYGVAGRGTNFPGFIFRVNKEGSDYRTLHMLPQDTLGRSFAEGAGPLIEASDGMLYGACSNTSNRDDGGFIYRLSRQGEDFEILRDFSATPDEPMRPAGGVIEGSDGFLYGQLTYGGGGDRTTSGAVYRISRTGTEYQLLHLFDAEGLHAPVGELLEGSDGLLYGSATQNRGFAHPNFASGGYFAVNKDGSGFTRLSPDVLPETPSAALIQASDGMLFGTALTPNDNGSIFTFATTGENFSHWLKFSVTNGVATSPVSLLDARDKWLYGVSRGVQAPPIFYKIRRDGSEYTALREFDPNGDLPPQTLYAEDADGNIYGTAHMVGSQGINSVVRLTPTGGYEYFRMLASPIPGGFGSSSAISRLEDGTFVGVRYAASEPYRGEVFHLSSDGVEMTSLRVFGGEPDDPGHPYHAPLLSSDGRFYGLTRDGIYRMNRDGTAYVFRRLFGMFDLFGTEVEPLHSVSANIVEAADGSFYGVAADGGPFGKGGVFRIAKDTLDLSVVHLFKADGSEGSNARSTLVQRKDGFVYGITVNGGTVHNSGVFFRVLPDGREFQVIHEFGHFENTPDNGRTPEQIIVGKDDVIYGSLGTGGAHGFGALFRFGEVPEISVETQSGEPLFHERGVIDFGEKEWGAPPTLVSVRLRNDGELPLQISDFVIAGPHAADYGVTPPAQNALGPGEFTMVEIRFTPAGPGRRQATLHWQNNDFDESPYRISLVASVPSPDIAVFDGLAPDAGELQHGQETFIDFGAARRGTALAYSFMVSNPGEAPLTISQVTVPAGYRTAATVPFTLAPNASSALVLSRDTTIMDILTGDVAIDSDDPDEPTFRFPIVSTVVDPEIVVHDGATTGGPELAAGQVAAVDFGQNIQGTPGPRFVTLANIGTAPLAVASIAVPPGYTLAASPALPTLIDPGSSASWQIRLVSLEVGVHTGSVVIASDDFDEPVFAFPVTGEVYIPAPVATLANSGEAATVPFNRQTGLREQTLRLANETTATVPGYRLLLRGLPTGVAVANASEVWADGTVVVLVRQPLAPFSSFDLVLEFASADRRSVTIAPEITVEVVLELPDDTVREDTGAFAIDRVVLLPEAGGLLLEFVSEAGRRYIVEYSDDGVTWKSSPTEVQGVGNRTQWIDRGPPRTASPPASHTVRFYRIILLPE